MKKKILRIIAFFMELSNRKVTTYAACAAFFLFISLIPTVMLICAIIPFVPITRADFMRIVVDAVPENVEPLMLSIINDVYKQSVGLISVTIIAIFWSAGKGLLALLTGLNAINGIKEKRNYFVLRIIASLYTVLIVVVIVIALIVMVFGKTFMEILKARIPVFSHTMNFVINGRHVLFFLIITTMLAFIYAYMPCQKTKFHKQIPGAVMASLGWTVVTFGFSIYVTYFNGFSMYGNLTTIIILLIWLYVCMQLVLAGAFVNKLRIDKEMKIVYNGEVNKK